MVFKKDAGSYLASCKTQSLSVVGDNTSNGGILNPIVTDYKYSSIQNR